MKKLIKNNYHIIILSIISLLIIHFILLTRNITTADVLINDFYYNGYSWEISLGRFGLYFIGLINNFIVIKEINIFISMILISLIIVFIIDIFKINKLYKKILISLLIVSSPIISSYLVFYYCSVGYLLSVLLSIISSYLLINNKNKLLSILCFIISLSMYQASISIGISIIVLYYIKEVINKKIKIKDIIYKLFIIFISMIIYFIIMKLSLVIFNIDQASYSGANKIGFSSILDIFNNIKRTYISFYDYFFTNKILKNTYIYNNIINIFLFIILIINIIKVINKKNCLYIIISLLLLPFAFNFILLITPSDNYQLLMSSSYLLFIPFIVSFDYDKYLKYIMIIISILLIRNYIIQDYSTYKSLENTFNKTYNLLSSNNDLDKDIMVIGDIKDISNINKYNYGFISDYSLFWDDYSNRRNGVIKFYKYYLGRDINYVSEDKYKELINKEYDNGINYLDDVVVICL